MSEKVKIVLLLAATLIIGCYYILFRMHPPALPTMTRTRLASESTYYLFSIKPEGWPARSGEENKLNATPLLEFLQLNSQEVLSKTKELVSNYCSDLKNDDYYRQRLESYLKAWHKSVPPHEEMDSSNCWYAGNMDFQVVSNLVQNVKFPHFHRQYRKDRVSSIMSKAFTNGNKVNTSATPTSDHFCLPKVNFIGFAKTGSTSIYDNLASHPLLAEPKRKESQFWREFLAINDSNYRELTVLSYLSIFSGASRMIAKNPDMFTIDASVYTVSDMPKPLQEPEKDACTVPLLISQTMPKLKLLVSVRDPTERLWSEFLFFCPPFLWKERVRSEQTPLAVASLFHNYTLTALEEFKACIESGHTQFHCAVVTGSIVDNSVGCRKLRLGMSIYYMLLITWFHVFPREQLLVTRLEDLSSKPSETMAEIWDFLDLPLDSSFHPKVAKQSPWSKDKTEMFPETRKLLDEFYHPYNVKLAQLLGDNRFLWKGNSK